MKIRNITILVVVLLLLDQILKFWIKTNMHLYEDIEILPWFHLHFVENNGAAFGMQIANAGGFDWGKLLLSLFRMVMIGLLGYYIYYLTRKRKDMPKGAKFCPSCGETVCFDNTSFCEYPCRAHGCPCFCVYNIHHHVGEQIYRNCDDLCIGCLYNIHECS